MWSGLIADIPTGWAFCDGTNGTPDLTDRFIKGVLNNTTDPGNIGGSTTHNHQLPFIDDQGLGGLSYQKSKFNGPTIECDEINSTSAPTGHRFGSSAMSEHASSLPPFYELAFIMKLEF